MKPDFPKACSVDRCHMRKRMERFHGQMSLGKAGLNEKR